VCTGLWLECVLLCRARICPLESGRKQHLTMLDCGAPHLTRPIKIIHVDVEYVEVTGLHDNQLQL